MASPTSTYVTCELFFYGLFGLCMWHARTRRTEKELMVALIYGTIVEFIVYAGMEYHQPRMYDHAPYFLIIFPGGVPMYICTLWATFLYVSNYIVRTHFEGQMLPSIIALPMVAGGFAMSMDTTMEPIATRYGMWTYRIGASLGAWILGTDVWHGSPLINLASWLHLQFAFTFVQVALPGKNNVLDVAKQVICAVILCIAMLWTLGPARLVFSDANLVKLEFLACALVAAYGCKVKTAPRDWMVVCIVALWHAGPLLSLATLPSSFSHDAQVELVALGIGSVALFGIGDGGGGPKWWCSRP